MSAIKTKVIEKYIVRRPFDEYEKGDEFIPTGKRNDKMIIEYYCDVAYIERDVCPGCGKEFKRLDMHKCTEVEK